MDLWDWILAVVMVAAAAALFYFLMPPYGALVGIVLGVLLVFIAYRRREKHRGSGS